MIRVNNLHVRYSWLTNRIDALTGVTFDINEGDYAAIVGPAGSGKSTLLAAIAGLIKPEQGEVHVGKYQMNKFGRTGRARVRADMFSIIFQFSEMMNRFTVEENLKFAYQVIPARNGESYEERRDRLVSALDMSELLSKSPGRLSGGQMQKAAIAMALIKNAPYILADEPSGDLDPASQKQLKKILKEEHSRGKTIVLITHDMKLALDAKTVYELVSGTISRVLK